MARSSKSLSFKRIKPAFFSIRPGGRPVQSHRLSLVEGAGNRIQRSTDFITYALVDHTRGEEASQKRGRKNVKFLIKSIFYGARESGSSCGSIFIIITLADTSFLAGGARFILRWPKNYQFLDEFEQLKKLGRIEQSQRVPQINNSLVWDARRRRWERQTKIIAFPVFDRFHHQPLARGRSRKGQSPWYLLTF